jgi:hypothetical protein
MENTFVYDLAVLKRVLYFTIKNLKKDKHLPDNSKYVPVKGKRSGM